MRPGVSFDKTKNELSYVLDNVKKSSLVLINLFSSTAFTHQNILPDTFDMLCLELNNYLRPLANRNILLIDINKVLAEVSIEKSVDLRYYYSSKALYSIEFYKHYAAHIKPAILSAQGKAKKALIFDCDNTLWKGIVGEDGLQGITMSGKHPDGVMFEEVQHLALALSKQGVLLGLCSKNNPQDVDDVLQNHPDMIIRDKDLAIKKVNWDDKAGNLAALAKELNIGLDSIVFVDDSPFEVNYIMQNLPAVTALQVPEKLQDYPKMLRDQFGLFFSISTSEEDARKTELYQVQARRDTEKARFISLEEYLKSLGLRVLVHIDDESLIPRMAQLTQKTNQFNLTTRRYTEADIRGFLHDHCHTLYAYELSDKFGNYGVIGLAIVELDREEAAASLDTFLMSCRAIGRNVEIAFFDFLMQHLKQAGFKKVSASYKRTGKNQQIDNFYETLGFRIIQASPDEKTYTVDIDGYTAHTLAYIGVNYGK